MKLAVIHHRKTESIWHIQLAVLAAIGLQLSLNSQLTVGPKYLIASLEVLLLIALTLIRPNLKRSVYHLRRALAILLIAIISLANVMSLGLVLKSLFSGSADVTGKELIVSGMAIYLTNIIIFALWYWELDRDDEGNEVDVEFLFPQMSSSRSELQNWQPAFFDYLYVSITNASAFSPTDAMPLTHRAKSLMTLQSMTSLTTVALVAARAVNILR